MHITLKVLWIDKFNLTIIHKNTNRNHSKHFFVSKILDVSTISNAMFKYYNWLRFMHLNNLFRCSRLNLCKCKLNVNVNMYNSCRESKNKDSEFSRNWSHSGQKFGPNNSN